MRRSPATFALLLFGWLLFVRTAAALPNLTPYQPPGWSDKITVSRFGYAQVDDAQFFQWDWLSVATPIINIGDTATTGQIQINLFVDNSYMGTSYLYTPLYPGESWPWESFWIGPLSAGAHTIGMSVTGGGGINYTDNRYIKTITVVAAPPPPNLAVYTFIPPGWSGNIVVSRTTGTTTDDTALTTADSLYVDLAVINDGLVATTTPLTITLSVDGTVVQTWTIDPPIGVNGSILRTDVPIGKLTAGSHFIKTIADPGDTIRESNETDNSYEKWITIAAATKKRRGQITSQ